jgi:hypothetical protein
MDQPSRLPWLERPTLTQWSEDQVLLVATYASARAFAAAIVNEWLTAPQPPQHFAQAGSLLASVELVGRY